MSAHAETDSLGRSRQEASGLRSDFAVWQVIDLAEDGRVPRIILEFTDRAAAEQAATSKGE